MKCAWKELLAVIPAKFRQEAEQIGADNMAELRMRINAPPEAVLAKGSIWLTGSVTREDLDFVLNAASRYSPWCASTMAQGYLTAPGGHRIGICGSGVCKDGSISGLREVTSLCIRVARDFPGIGEPLQHMTGSVLILGAPGWGKTTLLRDLIRLFSKRGPVSVADERGELFPEGFDRGMRTDILFGCPKGSGISMLLRTMGPAYIAVDEITEEADAMALMQAANCGVRLLATAHAASREEFERREIYRKLLEANIFDHLVLLHKDKSYHWERVGS